MQLGTFTKDPKTGGYVGAVRTLTSFVDPVRIVPRAKTADAPKNAPDYDVLGPSGSDFGAGWLQKREADSIEYVSLRLYDPAFNNGQALRPALWPRRDGSFVMIHEPQESAPGDPAPTRPPEPVAAAPKPNGKEASAKIA